MSKERKSQHRGRRKRATVARKSAGARARIRVTARDREAGRWFEKLVALQARLRGPGGCPWDAEQSHESLRKFLIEEAYEVLEAMESRDPKKFAGEMGDLLLQVVFHSILAEEAGNFTISDVIESVHSKMIRRHPHVFGEAKAESAAAVLKNWEKIKSEERAEESGAGNKGGKKGARNGDANPESVLAGVPRSLPAVLEAYQLTRRAAHIGFDWDSLKGIVDKLEEETRELQATVPATGSSGDSRVAAIPNGNAAESAAGVAMSRMEEEMGDLLFTGVNIARFLGVDPEIALKKANRKFRERFTWMESAAEQEGKRLAEVPRERMEELWNESKTEARGGKGRG